jgi:hypothetical protein
VPPAEKLEVIAKAIRAIASAAVADVPTLGGSLIAVVGNIRRAQVATVQPAPSASADGMLEEIPW